MSEEYSAKVDEQAAGQRLDKFLSAQLPALSRARVQALIADGCVRCNGDAITSASAKVKAGQTIYMSVPNAAPSHIAAQDIPLDIMFEDEHILVLNKSPGLTVHPAPGNADGTLVNALLAHCGDSLSGIGGVARPGIVHRIDKDTSGLLVVAKHDAAHTHLSEQLSARTLKRTYHALVWGVPIPAAGSIEGNIGRSPRDRKKMTVLRSGGKHAVTHYKIVSSYQSPVISFIECKLETGRTHQIRVHFNHKGHGLVGDPVYGQSTASRLKSLKLPNNVKQTLLTFNRQALHAARLGLIHPHTNEAMQFDAPLPEDMRALREMLESAS